MHFRLANHLFSINHAYTRPAYGVCSLMPRSRTWHYLLFDFDVSNKMKWAERILRDYFLTTYPSSPFYFYSSLSGFHCIVMKPYSLADAAIELLKCPLTDKKFVGIGLTRGYWFLETNESILNRKLSYMVIERDAANH